MLKKQLLRLGNVILAIAVILIVILFFQYMNYKNIDSTIDITISSEEGMISLEWDTNFFTRNHTARITISEMVNTPNTEETVETTETTDTEETAESEVTTNVVETIDVKYSEGQYEFTNGTPLSTYTIIFEALDEDGNVLTSREESRLFIEKFPDLPLMEITTNSGELPTFEVASLETTSSVRLTITNNEKESGSFTMTDGNETLYDTLVEINVRGNTSTIASEKRSYKLTFNENVDLVGDGAVYSNEWVLLNSGTRLNNYVGDLTSELCGIEWSLTCAFVNVVINGDYRGCYYVTPCVTPDASGGLIDDTGYIIEDDAYYWSPDAYSFSTQTEIAFNYTLKYPSVESENDPLLSAMAEYMQKVDDSVLAGDIDTYIDATSYAKWILAKDLLGNSDGSGSNKYFYLADFDIETATSNSKLKAGPLWDFDAIFRTSGAWSQDRYMDMYGYLLRSDEFVALYIDEFYRIEDDFLEEMTTALDSLAEEQGMAIDESWQLDHARWGGYYYSFENQYNDIIAWFTMRIPFIEENMGI